MRIREAAILLANGEIRTGPAHHEILWAMNKAGERPPVGSTQGFVTEDGEFASRRAALQIAILAEHLAKKKAKAWTAWLKRRGIEV
jgi:hypothetical protein